MKQNGKKADGRPLFDGYKPLEGAYDEIFGEEGVRNDVAVPIQALDALSRSEFVKRRSVANSAFFEAGVTFSVYGDEKQGVERIFPFDLLPRIISAKDWVHVERGLDQRVRALNMFLLDVYGEQRILKEDKIPRGIVEGSEAYLAKMHGVVPPAKTYIHIAGIDLIRGPSGEFLVLEDNVRTPSGVSYVLENRAMMKRVLPAVFAGSHVRNVDEYPRRLRETLSSRAAADVDQPNVVVLTPGAFNSAYFEHSYLARRMGCHLVEARDLFVHDDYVYLKTTHGPERVDVIYRRIDDEFLDPEVFRPDSLLGVPGIVRAYAKGHVTLANALGNGVADDKAVYPFVPDMIRFYLDEEPVLGQVETYICERKSDRAHVLANLESMVVKAVNASGGYGMLMGPTASKAELEEFAERIRANPRGYIAQPRIELSTCPSWIDGEMQPRRVDLRPYVLTTASSSWVLPGGLTRVALAEGSYVVNSSQGGGSKDTWVLDDAS